MLTLLGKNHTHGSFCDQLSRRNFLQIGSLGLSGLTLPRLLQAESNPANKKRQKSVIMIYLVGGPPHQDMIDLKPEAPKEISRPLATDLHERSRHRNL